MSEVNTFVQRDGQKYHFKLTFPDVEVTRFLEDGSAETDLRGMYSATDDLHEWLAAGGYEPDASFARGAATATSIKAQQDTPPDVVCEFCKGDVWDNRKSKKSARMPDYRCKDREGCGAAAWIKKEGGLSWRPGDE